jgi:hypothetical protein
MVARRMLLAPGNPRQANRMHLQIAAEACKRLIFSNLRT